jgi:hypothetical protein
MKLVTVAALAAGYVLGTRAGRERYEQIRELTHNARDNFDASAARRKLEAYGSRLDAYATRPSSRKTPPR